VPRRVLLVVDGGPGPVETNVVLALASHRVSVVVRTPSGEPVASAQVFVLDDDGQPVDSNPRAKTNLEGRVELAGLGAGECTILATHERLSGAGRRVHVDEGLGDVVLTMPEAVKVQFESPGLDGPFSFRVTDAGGVTVFEDACTEVRRFGQGRHDRPSGGAAYGGRALPGVRAGREDGRRRGRAEDRDSAGAPAALTSSRPVRRTEKP
jgi:hypothetical protein